MPGADGIEKGLQNGAELQQKVTALSGRIIAIKKVIATTISRVLKAKIRLKNKWRLNCCE